jgi:hypothetical protein
MRTLNGVSVAMGVLCVETITRRDGSNFTRWGGYLNNACVTQVFAAGCLRSERCEQLNLRQEHLREERRKGIIQMRAKLVWGTYQVSKTREG